MTAKSKPTETTNAEQSAPQSNRETVESIVVAVILAFLFRTFVAEAFGIDGADPDGQSQGCCVREVRLPVPGRREQRK
jgi:hypothetical protein